MIGLLQSGTGIGRGMCTPMPSNGLLDPCVLAGVRVAAGRIGAAVAAAAVAAPAPGAGAPRRVAPRPPAGAATRRVALERARPPSRVKGWEALPASCGASATLGAGGATAAVAAVAAAPTPLAGAAAGAVFAVVPEPLPPDAGGSPDDLWCLPCEPPPVPFPCPPRPPPGRLRPSDTLPAESWPSVCVTPSRAASPSSPPAVGSPCATRLRGAHGRRGAGPPRSVLTRMRASGAEVPASWEETRS
jgi:hypothetical protein